MMSNLRWAVVLCCFSGVGCIPLPVPRTATIQPMLELRVVDAATGTAVPNALITVVRYSYPDRTASHSVSFKTDSQGQAVLTQITEREWTFPLMIHGVPEHHHALAVWAPGYYRAVRGTEDIAAPIEIRLWPTATPGSSDQLTDQQIAEFGSLRYHAGSTLHDPSFVPAADYMVWCKEHSDLEASGTVQGVRPGYEAQDGIAWPRDVLSIAVASSAGPRAPAPATIEVLAGEQTGAKPGASVQLFLRWQADSGRYSLAFGRYTTQASTAGGY